MATFPTAHSSSPAVVKVTHTSATISSAAFDPPARVAIVVGVTSDADTNAGSAPTLTAITGLTWTRVGPALGFSATGDVGLVALFQGVLDNPATDLGSITVTANVGITASKPKMLVVRVYDETQVDISDPIGAFTSGSFATSTSFLGTVTPETSDGGLRGLWLDWNATGVPATILPNNDNSEVVDTYHNAGLSTNAQIGRRNRTVAGVGQSLGALLLGTSSDGNWLVYELRSPQPAAGPAFDSGAFSSAAFATPSTGGATGTLSASAPVVTSSIAGTAAVPVYTGSVSASVPRATASISGTATVPTSTGSISASTPLATASIAGTVTAPTYTGSINATLPLVTGSATGSTTVPTYTGSVAASMPLTIGSLAGTVVNPSSSGTISASVPVVTGSLTGTVAPPVYSGTLSAATPKVTGSASGTATPPTYSGTLTASVPPTQATISGTVTTPAGSATLSGTVPRVTASLTGTFTAPVWTGTLSAQVARLTASMIGTATGPVYVGSLSATLPKVTGSTTGTVTPPAATGSLAGTLPKLTGSLTGTYATDPGYVPPSITAARRLPLRFAARQIVPAPDSASTPARFHAGQPAPNRYRG